jgi:FKBP-type peptidyl-prolyl cis-trans isomerase
MDDRVSKLTFSSSYCIWYKYGYNIYRVKLLLYTHPTRVHTMVLLLLFIIITTLFLSTHTCNAFISVSSSSSSLIVVQPPLKQTTSIVLYKSDQTTVTTCCRTSLMTLQSKINKLNENHDNNKNKNDGDDLTVSVNDRPRRNMIMSSSTAVISSLLLHQSFTMKSKPSLAYAYTTTPTIPTITISNNNKDLKEEYRQGTAALNNDMDSMSPVPREAYVKLPSGVIYADVVKPSNTNNNIVKVGSKVNIEWVLRRSNGYFVDSSQVHENGIPFVFTVGEQPSTAIVGLDEGIRGMQVGGVRRLLIPPSLAYVQGVNDGLPGPIPVGYGPRQQIRRIQNVRKDVPGEYIYLEIQLTRLR